jgi:hypothetical protein
VQDVAEREKIDEEGGEVIGSRRVREVVAIRRI